MKGNEFLSTSDKLGNLEIKNCEEDLIIREEIGKGAYSIVKEGVSKLNGIKAAIKIYDKTKIMNEEIKNNVKNEATILMQLSHPNIVKFYKIFETEKELYLRFGNIIKQMKI